MRRVEYSGAGGGLCSAAACEGKSGIAASEGKQGRQLCSTRTDWPDRRRGGGRSERHPALLAPPLARYGVRAASGPATALGIAAAGAASRLRKRFRLAASSKCLSLNHVSPSSLWPVCHTRAKAAAGTSHARALPHLLYHRTAAGKILAAWLAGAWHLATTEMALFRLRLSRVCRGRTRCRRMEPCVQFASAAKSSRGNEKNQ